MTLGDHHKAVLISTLRLPEELKATFRTICRGVACGWNQMGSSLGNPAFLSPLEDGGKQIRRHLPKKKN